MDVKKKLKILGVILAFLFAFPLHFLYDKFPSFVTSIISPVNESIWEHMKILFGSILLAGVTQKIIVKIKKLNINNVCISNFTAALLSIPIFLIIYIPIYNTIGEKLPITLIIMFIVIVIAEIISYLIMKKDDLKLENMAIIFTIIVYTVFGLLTYFPPKQELFLDPEKLIYGIKK
jgi:hypothetical protein